MSENKNTPYVAELLGVTIPYVEMRKAYRNCIKTDGDNAVLH